MDGTCPRASITGIVKPPVRAPLLQARPGKEKPCLSIRMPTSTIMALGFPMNWVLFNVMAGITSLTALAADMNMILTATD
eukprot:3952958-Karenia_brevis.AAC.1